MLFFINIILAYEYYIKLYNKELYLRSEKLTETRPTMDVYDKKNTFILEKLKGSNNEKIINVKANENYALNIEGVKTKLIYFPVTKNINERFEIVPIDMISIYLLQTMDKCLTFEEDKSLLSIMECTESNPHQMFEFICSNCPGITKDTSIKVPEEVNRKTEVKTSFLTNEVAHIIREIGHFATKMSSCFSKNGMCKALDNDHEKTYCYSPFNEPSNVSVIWPDLRIKSPHIEDIPNDPANHRIPNMEVMRRIFKSKKEQCHKLDDHLNKLKSLGTLKDVGHGNDEIIKNNKEDFIHRYAINQLPKWETLYNFKNMDWSTMFDKISKSSSESNMTRDEACSKVQDVTQKKIMNTLQSKIDGINNSEEKKTI